MIQKKRIAHIDMIEAIAMFFVILYHCSMISFNFMTEPTVINHILFYLKTILATCVPLFFFANGYLLFSKKLDLRKHLAKMVKLVILTIIWAVITLLCLQVIKGEFLSLTEFVKSVWTWKQGWINYLWYMGALFCLYVFFPLLKSAYDTNLRGFIWFTVVCALFTFGNTFIVQFGTAVLYLFFGRSVSVEGLNVFNMFNPFRGILGYTFVYFCLGGFAFQFRDRIESIPTKKRNLFAILGIVVSCFGAAGLGYCYSAKNGSIWDVVWFGYDTVFTLANVICIYVLSLNWKKDNRIIRTISDNTLGVYFMHGILLSLVKPLILSCDFLLNPIAKLLICAVILGVCVLICLVLKKIPILSKLVK